MFGKEIFSFSHQDDNSTSVWIASVEGIELNLPGDKCGPDVHALGEATAMWPHVFEARGQAIELLEDMIRFTVGQWYLDAIVIEAVDFKTEDASVVFEFSHPEDTHGLWSVRFAFRKSKLLHNKIERRQN